MKKILIISYLFAPKAEIGAIRWTKIAKYLGKKGYVTDIITRTPWGKSDEILARDAEEINGTIHRVAHSNAEFDKASAAVKANTAPVAASINGIVNKIKRSEITRRIREHLKKRKTYQAMERDYDRGVDFCNQLIAYMQENSIDPTEYDAVISSFGPVGCALAALKLKELYPNMRLIMDFRDPMNNYMQSPKMQRRYAEIQDKLCDAADKVIAISQGNAKKIFRSEDKHKLSVITNGFDIKDTEGIIRQEDNMFSFCATGSLYDGQRDNSDLFMVLSKLVSNGIISKDKLRFDYAGRDFAVLAAQAQKFGMGNILCDHGELNRAECLRLQCNSRFLVFNTWNFKDNEGILPGKIFEYMMMHRPIIGIVTGRLPNSEARHIIETANAGIVFERGDYKASCSRLYDYLANECERFRKGLECSTVSSDEDIMPYDYRSITERIDELID